MTFSLPQSPADYASLYANMQIVPNDSNVLAIAVAKIKMSKDIYDSVEAQTNVPWYMLGSLHYREASLNFNCYFQNGDPLFGPDGSPIKTTNIPTGIGPFATWADSAIADLKPRAFPKTWAVGDWLHFAERFNGLGYYHMNMASPYVWAGSDYYTGGLYIGDGQFDGSVFDTRPGVAPILKQLSA